MPSEEALHQRYARALVETAQKEGKLENVMEALELLNEYFLKDEKFRRLLLHPLITPQEKKIILGEVFQHIKIEHPLNDFLYLLIDDRRIDLLHGIFLSYRDQYRLEKHLMHVYVEIAQELSPYDKHELREALQKKFKKEVEMELNVNPEVLAGIYIRWQNNICNDTAQRKLAMIKEPI